MESMDVCKIVERPMGAGGALLIYVTGERAVQHTNGFLPFASMDRYEAAHANVLLPAPFF